MSRLTRFLTALALALASSASAQIVTGGGGGSSGGATSPGGSDTQIQINSASSFGALNKAVSDGAGSISFTNTTGTAPFSVSSTTVVTNLNAAKLNSATFGSPGAIGNGVAGTGAFTTLSASSTVAGTGFSTYLASPPAIGGTVAAAGAFTTLTDTSETITGTGGAGYAELQTQSATPSTAIPSLAVRLFANSAGNLSWIKPDGFARSFASGTYLADHTITFPTDTDLTVARIDAAQTFTGVETFSSAPIFSSMTATSVACVDGSKALTVTCSSATPAFGATTATTLNGWTFNSATISLTGTTGQTYTLPATTSTLAQLGANNFVGTQTVGTGGNMSFTGAGAFLKFNAIALGLNIVPTCSVPTGATGSPICSPTNTGGSFSMKLTFSGGTGSFSGTTMTVTFATGATNNGYLCDGVSGTGLTTLTNHMQTTGMTTTITTLTFYNAAGTAVSPGLTDVVVLKCMAS